MSEIQPLHLPDLYIEGFRGIDELSIPCLGRVTLLAGKNSVGKTTVLDALRVYAARGRYSALSELLEGRDEFFSDVDEDGDTVLMPDISALFYGWNTSGNSCVKIGPNKESDQLRIELASQNDVWELIHDELPARLGDIDAIQVVKITFQESIQVIPLGLPFQGRRLQRRSASGSEMPPTMKCESLGPGVLANQDLARFWDNVALTDDEESAIESLRFIFGDSIEGIAVIGDNSSRFVPSIRPIRRGGRRVMVKLDSHSRPVPLRSLGDGASRMFGVSMALANSRNGFLLLDEAENGIHHSLQHNFWRMVLRTALDNNVQVLATTHSWDCVRGFALAAVEYEEAEGLLYRLEKHQDIFQMVDYSKEDLGIVAEQNIEVR